MVGTWPSGAERPDAGSGSAARSRTTTVVLTFGRRRDLIGERLFLARRDPAAVDEDHPSVRHAEGHEHLEGDSSPVGTVAHENLLRRRDTHPQG